MMFVALFAGLLLGNSKLVRGQDLRPIYHFSAPQGWLGDPCGFVYDQGEYHMCYQWTPNSTTADFGAMYWGHAVSPDLVHWSNLPYELAPDDFGSCWDGSTVVDFNNSAGFGVNALITIYTATGYGFVQNMATSTDLGRTWAKYGGNPVLPTVRTGNHDPCVFWYAPGNKWVMTLYLSNNDYGIFSSTDLKHWTQTSTFTFPGVIEVPQLFSLPLDGNTNNVKWIFYAGAGNYYVGQFDGNTFTPQYGPFSIRGGNSFAAAQIFNDMPGYDGRTILIGNGTQDYPNQPFQSAMDFPVELTLVTSGGVPTLYVNPVRELASLRTSTQSWPSQSLPQNVNLLTNITGTAYELDVNFRPAAGTQTTFTLGGLPVTYDSNSHQLSAAGYVSTLTPIYGAINLQFLVDRGIVEIFGNNGQAYMPMSVTAVSGPQPLSMVTSGAGGRLLSMQMHILSAQQYYPGTSTRWTMSPTGNNTPAVQDILTTDGAQNLWTFNGLTNAYPVSASVPPDTMFANGNTGGANSFNASAFTNVDGALFYPQDIYGNVFAFTNSFAVELFFKSNGDQSGAGSMELLMQGENAFRYGLVVNEAGPGSVRFALNDGQGHFPVADLAARNYADGTWHYLLASYDRKAASNGRLTLTIANQDGSVDTTNVDIGDFDGLPPGNDGNLFIGRYTYSVSNGPRTFLGLINQVQITSGLLPGIKRLGALPSDSVSISRWNMEPFNTNTPAVLDQLRGQDLWAFNGLSNAYVTSTDTPPAAMFANGNAGGLFSYDAESITNVDGTLFYPQDIYGNDFAFTNSFSVELFFKSDGDQSGAGVMELLMQGENNFRYGLDLNEAGPGAARFTLSDGQGEMTSADLSARNYADGTWHYLLATYDPSIGTNGALKLIIANQDGTVDNVVSNIDGAFKGLAAGNDGNLFIGRYRYPITDDHRTFRGLINEVQVAIPSVSSTQRLGNLPAPPIPQIVGAARTGQGLSLNWNSTAWAGYDVLHATTLSGPWSVISSVTGGGATTTYQETNTTRLANATGFYRIRVQ
jgi:sucrose-6-phosphate hydrolase SacC (GH32 family)